MIFRNPQMLALLLLIPATIIVWRWRGKRLSMLVLLLRLIVVTLIVLALADPTTGQPPLPSEPLVVLIDQSDSLTPQGQALLRSRIDKLVQLDKATKDNDEPAQPVYTLWFGNTVINPKAWSDVSPDQAVPQSLIDTLDPSGSNIEQALRTSRALLADSGGHVVLLSDGIQTTGHALAEAHHAVDSGIKIDVWPIDPSLQPDIRIARIHVPASLYVGEEYDVQIVVENCAGIQPCDTNQPGPTSQTQATLRLWEKSPAQDKEQLLAEQQVTLEPGHNTFTFRHSTETSGISSLRSTIEGIPDTFADNNSGAATTMVELPPRVLLVEGREGNASAMSTTLWNAGIENDSISAKNLPSRLSQLQPYDGMMLIDVSAHDLSLDQMSSVREFVRSEGRGLLVTGGRQTFSLGSYQNTPLASVLPILVDPPPRPERSNVALLLMIDRSASMSIPVDVSKFDMAKEAAILSTETLQSDDSIGILAFDTRQEWTIPFQQIGTGLTLQQIQDQIVLLDFGGGTDIYGALEVGLQQLMVQDATLEVRHAVLLTDGRSFTNDRASYQELINTARDYGITLSSIAIGIDSDTELLDDLAQWGNGRYYYADKPEDIPRLTLQESEIARSDPVVEGYLQVQVEAPHPLLRGFSPANIPNLEGYVATTRRDNAEVVLHAPGTIPSQADPLLATWQYGLGRVVAWTSSIAEPWANPWTTWDEYASFWAQAVRYTLPKKPTSGPLQIHIEPQEKNQIRMEVDAFEPGGKPLDLADTAARVTLPNGSYHEMVLHQVAPGRYVQDMTLPSPGAYTILVVLEREGQRYQAEAGYVHPVPAEYNPTMRQTDAGTRSGDRAQGVALLERIAEHTGGQILHNAYWTMQDGKWVVTDEVTEGEEEISALDSVGDWVRQQLSQRDLWPWLLSVALVLWLLEIAFRRQPL